MFPVWAHIIKQRTLHFSQLRVGLQNSITDLLGQVFVSGFLSCGRDTATEVPG